MISVLLAGAALGAGLFWCWHALAGAPVRLDHALARLERRGSAVSSSAASGLGHRVLGSGVAQLARRSTIGDLSSDLAVCDRDEQRHVIDKLVMSLALSGVAIMLVVVLGVGGISLPAITVVVLVVLGAGVGLVLPDLTLRTQAAARRHAFRHALSSYLDLVNVLLAGGAGMETSLVAAAEAGDGWVFDHLRTELLRSRSTRRSPWDCFRELGERLGIVELVELSATVQLAGEQGARVKHSLAARAGAMRAHQLARLEADAQSATERMGLPTVLMFVGFVALLGYPALQMIVGGL